MKADCSSKAVNLVQNEMRMIAANVSGTAVAQIAIYRTRSGNLHQIVSGAGGQSECI